MKIAYCPTCKPAAILAIGSVPTEIIVKGKKQAVKPPSHVVGTEIHTAKTAEVKDLTRLLGEALDVYLKRVAETYKGALV